MHACCTSALQLHAVVDTNAARQPRVEMLSSAMQQQQQQHQQQQLQSAIGGSVLIMCGRLE
jgi:hypothetical protein